MKALLILSALMLTGCASSPFLDMKAVAQHDSGSDWVLQSERPWTADKSEGRLHLAAGLEWDNQIDCPYIEVIMVGPWDWMGIGCTKRIGSMKEGRLLNGFLAGSLVHQVDSRTSEFLGTDQKQWQGHNPFMHVRFGLQWKYKIRCPVIATGKSVFQGAPFEKEEGEPDLYWMNVECGKRFGGK